MPPTGGRAYPTWSSPPRKPLSCWSKDPNGRPLGIRGEPRRGDAVDLADRDDIEFACTVTNSGVAGVVSAAV